MEAVGSDQGRRERWQDRWGRTTQQTGPLLVAVARSLPHALVGVAGCGLMFFAAFGAETAAAITQTLLLSFGALSATIIVGGAWLGWRGDPRLTVRKLEGATDFLRTLGTAPLVAGVALSAVVVLMSPVLEVTGGQVKGLPLVARQAFAGFVVAGVLGLVVGGVMGLSDRRFDSLGEIVRALRSKRLPEAPWFLPWLAIALVMAGYAPAESVVFAIAAFPSYAAGKTVGRWVRPGVREFVAMHPLARRIWKAAVGLVAVLLAIALAFAAGYAALYRVTPWSFGADEAFAGLDQIDRFYRFFMFSLLVLCGQNGSAPQPVSGLPLALMGAEALASQVFTPLAVGAVALAWNQGQKDTPSASTESIDVQQPRAAAPNRPGQA